MSFVVRTNNPCPTFHLDMTPEERALRQRHVGCWSEKAERGIAVVFGPVMDPKGVYGMGPYKVEDEGRIALMPRAIVGAILPQR